MTNHNKQVLNQVTGWNDKYANKILNQRNYKNDFKMYYSFSDTKLIQIVFIMLQQFGKYLNIKGLCHHQCTLIQKR